MLPMIHDLSMISVTCIFIITEKRWQNIEVYWLHTRYNSSLGIFS